MTCIARYGAPTSQALISALRGTMEPPQGAVVRPVQCGGLQVHSMLASHGWIARVRASFRPDGPPLPPPDVGSAGSLGRDFASRAEDALQQLQHA